MSPILYYGSHLLRHVASALLFALASALAVVIYRLSFHPLRHVPGPKLAAVSNMWHAYHARNGQMFRLGKDLHRRYGPVVRVGPNEVWFNSRDAFKSIYGTSSIKLASLIYFERG